MSPKCYISLNHKKTPRCEVSDDGCTTCKKALVAYLKAKETVRMRRKKKNRESAARSRRRKEEKYAKIVKEHTALVQQKKNQESYLNQLTQNKLQLRQLIKKKTHERNSRREVIAHKLAKELVKCPKDILNHLQYELTASINTNTLPNNTL